LLVLALALPLAVIINPISGTGGHPGRGDELRRSVTAMLQQRRLVPDVRLTDGPGHAHAIATDLAGRGFGTVVAWGGDGTVNEVGSALAFTKTRLAIAPLGSGNGLARGLGIPLHAAQALDVAVGPHDVQVDVGELDGRRFLNVAGVGLDAAIAARFASAGGRRGLRRYVELTLREVFAHRPQACVVVANGEEIAVTPLMITLANSRQFGNGAVIAPHARTDDGELDMVIVTERAPLIALLQAPVLFLGGATRLPGVIVRRVSEVQLRAAEPIAYHVDGEPGIGGQVIEARVYSRALRVAVPGLRA
jgi:diacylglycerol kinase (ATP)